MSPHSQRDTPLSQRKAVLLAAFFDRLREVMHLRGMTQTELARRLGVGDATVSEWFTRGRVPLAEVMLLLPGVLHVNGHWLLTGEGPRELPLDSETDPYRMAVEDVLGEIARTLDRLRQKHGVGTPPPDPQQG